MKKLLGIATIIGLLILSACHENSQTKAKIPGAFEVVSEDDISWSKLTVVKHKETGCYYVLTESTGSDDSVNLTQMYVNKYGRSLPYCER